VPEVQLADPRPQQAKCNQHQTEDDQQSGHRTTSGGN
jgi:hypothetical protein